MVRLATPVHSDDDFDLLYDAQSVSDVSDDQSQNKQTTASPTAIRDPVTSSQRLSGPHEIPVMPFTTSTEEDDVAAVTQQFVSHSIRHSASTSGIQPSSGSTRSRGSFVNDGLQYTKSVYNKLLNKDALIAVMG